MITCQYFRLGPGQIIITTTWTAIPIFDDATDSFELKFYGSLWVKEMTAIDISIPAIDLYGFTEEAKEILGYGE